MSRNGVDWRLVVGPAIVFGLWFLLKKFFLLNDIFLPSIGKTFSEIGTIFTQDGLADLVMTLYRVIASVGIALLLAVPSGLILGYHTSLYRQLEIVIDFFRSVPATAFFPLFILAFGIGNTSIIALSSFVCFWMILVNSIYGVWNCPKTRIKIAKSLGAGTYFLFNRIIVFDALPQILIGLRLSLSLSLVIVIVSEMLMGTKYGLGRIVYEGYATYQYARLYGGILLIGTIGYLINKITVSMERHLVHWIGH